MKRCGLAWSESDGLQGIDLRCECVEHPKDDQKRQHQRRKRQDGDAHAHQNNGYGDADDEHAPHADIGPSGVKEGRQCQSDQTGIEAGKPGCQNRPPVSHQHAAGRRHDAGHQEVGGANRRRDENGCQEKHARQLVALKAELRAAAQHEPPVRNKARRHRWERCSRRAVSFSAPCHPPAIGQSRAVGSLAPSTGEATRSRRRTAPWPARLSRASDLHVQPTIPPCAISALSVTSLNSGK